MKGSKFRQLFNAPRFEWCALKRGAKNYNFFTRSIVDAAKNTLKQAIQDCPYFGRYELVNIRMDKKVIAFYPAGIFRLDLKITDAHSKQGIFVSFSMEFLN
jgi:hypothetical protein